MTGAPPTFGQRTHPVEVLDTDERDRCRALVLAIGEPKARAILGRLNRATFYKCVAGLPVSRLTAQVLRAALSALPTDDP